MFTASEDTMSKWEGHFPNCFKIQISQRSFCSFWLSPAGAAELSSDNTLDHLGNRAVSPKWPMASSVECVTRKSICHVDSGDQMHGSTFHKWKTEKESQLLSELEDGLLD